MAEQLFTNNGDATMSGTLAQGGLSFTLGAGQGADFPAPTGGDYFLGTIYEKDGAGVDTKLEVVKVTTRTADTLDIERDFESMTGQVGGYAYDGNTTTVYFSERWTAHAAGQVLQKQDNLAGVADAAAALLNLGGAPLASPALTGTPTAPTAASGTNTTQIASTAFVTGAVADLVAASPAALDTLNELAAALGDDANFAATTATALGLKEVAANKDASGGYPGLTLFKLNLRNAANTITSWFTTAATVARTWTLPDKDGTVAMTNDLISTSISNTPAGNIVATTVQAAIDELDTEKAALAGSASQAFSTAALTVAGLHDISGAAAGQIKFPSTQNASSNANTLDDYEEGTWTPTDSSGGGLSLTVDHAYYTKIGRVVHFQCNVTYPVNSDNTYVATVGGLPFAASKNAAVAAWGYQIHPTSRTASGATYLSLFIGDTTVYNSVFSGKTISISGSYTI